MDGRLAVFYKGEKLTMIQPAQLGPPQLEVFTPAAHELAGRPVTQPKKKTAAPPAVKKTPKKVKPSVNHPWNRAARAHIERKQGRKRQRQEGSG